MGIQDLGLVALILKKYSLMPRSLRELRLEEAFEKAEDQCLKLLEEMVKQKKLAEDVGFHGHDLANLMEAFA